MKMGASRKHLPEAPSPPAHGKLKGDQIRQRIDDNRMKRLAIAEAMKNEAGVTGHEVNKEGFGGLAYIGTGRIVSPAGQNILQLYTVAHECGHIFLQDTPPGIYLPSHVKEMEAESYAHQAFREHGMTMPRRLSDWGRRYVGSWIEKDIAAGVAIDPRAVAYANGTRSPYEQLRMVPDTWRLHTAEASGVARSVSMPTGIRLRAASVRRGWRWLAGTMRSAALREGTIVHDAVSLFRETIFNAIVGSIIALGLTVPLHNNNYLPELGPAPSLGWFTVFHLLAAIAAGVIWSGTVLLWRTTQR
jgi:hypothetical protein